jgi:LacI family transcriptional regulator
MKASLPEAERITVKEIARLAGVSIGTVDRALHDRGGVSTETKERIDSIVASFGYEPNVLARQLSLNKASVLRVVLPRSDQDSGYWGLCLEGIRKAERVLSPYGVRLRVDEFDRYDAEAYRALLSDIVAEPCDGMLVAPVLPDELWPVLKALEGGRGGRPIPYAFFDGDIEGASPVAAVAQDAFKGGYLAGRLMSLLASPEGSLVALSAHAGDRHIKRRIEGFRAYFESSPRSIETVECASLEEPKARDRFLEPLFRMRSGIAGVLVANSSGHLVGNWLAARGAKASISIVSWDAVPANLRALGDGAIDGLISQRPAEQAREGLERLFRAVLRGSAARDELSANIPIGIILKENIPVGDSYEGEKEFQ